MEESRLGVEMSAETPSSTGVAGDTAVSTSFPVVPILPAFIKFVFKFIAMISTTKYKEN